MAGLVTTTTRNGRGSGYADGNPTFRRYSSSGTIQKPLGCTIIVMECIGAGGGGGAGFSNGANPGAGGGGGGAALARGTFNAESLGSTLTLAIGGIGEGGDTEERVSDLEDALDELKAEFEKMLAGANGEEEAEETAIAPAPETQPELARVEGKEAKDDAKAETKETVKEYAIKKSADNADHSEKSAKSPVAVKGGAKSGATPVKTGSGSEDKGRPAPTAQKMGSFENSPGKDKGTSMKKEVKADTKAGSEKSAKSPIGGK